MECVTRTTLIRSIATPCTDADAGPGDAEQLRE
jgi:hypothetical protein